MTQGGGMEEGQYFLYVHCCQGVINSVYAG